MTVLLTIVVVLIVALVMLTIFQSGLGPATTILQMQSICAQKFTTSCVTLGTEPGDWNVKMQIKEGTKSCKDLMTCSCEKATKTVTECKPATPSPTKK